MLRHHLLLTFRNFKRNKSSFFINLIGLSTGLACSILIYLWVSNELNVDKFHTNGERIYQIFKSHIDQSTIETSPHTPHPLSDKLEMELAEIEQSCNVIPAKLCKDFLGSFKLSTDQETPMLAEGQFAEKDFFKIFSYKLLIGDESDVLNNPGSIVISETLAEELYGSVEDALGSQVNWDLATIRGEAKITGIFENIPVNSSEQFDFVLDFHEWTKLYREVGGYPDSWRNSAPYTYLTVKSGTDKVFEEKIKNFLIERELSKDELLAVPYTSLYLRNNFANGRQVDGGIVYVRLFSIVALLIILIASINFMNLSTAKATDRMKAIGIKKTLGFGKKTLVAQYMTETFIITVTSIAIAVILVMLLLPSFNTITGKQIQLVFNIELSILIIIVTLLTTVLAGLYPSFYLSNLSILSSIKKRVHSSVSEKWIREGLVVFQFCISTILITVVVVIYLQIELIKHKDLGFSREQVISFQKDLPRPESLEPFLEELKKLPGVINAACMSGGMTGMQSETGGISWEGKDPTIDVGFRYIESTPNLIETLDLELISGRDFSTQSDQKNGIIINETAAEVIGLEDPVGSVINVWGKQKQIIGLVKDFHFQSIYHDIQPLFMYQSTREAFRIMVRLEEENQKETITSIGEAYKKFNPSGIFNSTYLESDYQKMYQYEHQISMISKVCAGLAIIISALGLLGLVSFMVEKRKKEMGIRKALGSGYTHIIGILTKSYSRMILIAILFATPISFLIADRWLNSFAYHIDLSWWYFAGAGLLTLLIAWLTVGFQTIKAAMVNPAKILRSE